MLHRAPARPIPASPSAARRPTAAPSSPPTIPTILSSAILGPVSTLVFRLTNVGVSAGMGTCGLVGPLGVIAAAEKTDARLWIGLVLLCVVLPAAVTLAISELMRKLGWIRPGDLKLDL